MSQSIGTGEPVKVEVLLAYRLKVVRRGRREVALEFGNQRHIGLTPLAVPPLQAVDDLPLQNRIGPAALHPLHLMLVLEVEIGQGT